MDVLQTNFFTYQLKSLCLEEWINKWVSLNRNQTRDYIGLNLRRCKRPRTIQLLFCTNGLTREQMMENVGENTPGLEKQAVPPLQPLYQWRGRSVRHMGQGWPMGLCPAPLLLPLYQKHEALAHRDGTEVAKIPLSSRWVSGGLVDREKEQGDHRMDYHIQRRQRSSLYRVRTEGGFLSHIQIGRDNSNECKLDLFPLSWKNSDGPRDNSLVKCGLFSHCSRLDVHKAQWGEGAVCNVWENTKLKKASCFCNTS